MRGRVLAGCHKRCLLYRTDAAVKQFLAFRLGEVSANHAGLASELRAVKVCTDVGEEAVVQYLQDSNNHLREGHWCILQLELRMPQFHVRVFGIQMDREATACKLDEARQHRGRRWRLLLWRPQPHNWPTFDPSLTGRLGQQHAVPARHCRVDMEQYKLYSAMASCGCAYSLTWISVVATHCSERSQAESRLRSQLDALSRSSERLHDDVRALTAVKCELEAEVGLPALLPFLSTEG
jgi:hypothetical protein